MGGVEKSLEYYLGAIHEVVATLVEIRFAVR